MVVENFRAHSIWKMWHREISPHQCYNSPDLLLRGLLKNLKPDRNPLV